MVLCAPCQVPPGCTIVAGLSLPSFCLSFESSIRMSQAGEPGCILHAEHQRGETHGPVAGGQSSPQVSPRGKTFDLPHPPTPTPLNTTGGCPAFLQPNTHAGPRLSPLLEAEGRDAVAQQHYDIRQTLSQPRSAGAEPCLGLCAVPPQRDRAGMSPACC